MGSQRGSGLLLSRSRKQWIARLVAAAAAIVFGILSIASSLANVIVKVDPKRAATLAPGNGVLTAASAQDMFLRRPVSGPRSRAAQLARKALLDDPTAVEALVVLGFQAQLRGDQALSDRIFAYATRLSRRELRPQIWAIEEAVSRGDIARALRHYDIALRTSSEAPSILYPTLAAALAEPRIRASLLRIMGTDPVWAQSFVVFVATSGIEPEGGISFLLEGRSLDLPVNDDLRASLVNALVARNKPSQAWAYYKTYRPEADRRRSRDPFFILSAETRAAFDWTSGVDPGLSAAILNDGRRGMVDFSVPPGAGGVLLEQKQLLPAGAYIIEGASSGVEQPQRSRPYWVLICQDGRELGRVVLPNSSLRGGSFSGRFTVPKDCGIQTLALIVRATDDIAGVSGQIKRAQLMPVGRAGT